MPRITVTVDEETEGWLISQQAETGRTVAAAARFAIENAMRADQCRERAGVTSSRPAPSPPTTDRQAAAVAGSEDDPVEQAEQHWRREIGLDAWPQATKLV